MNNRYAIFFAATGPMAGRNYIADANCLLNSIEKHRLHTKVNGVLDVYLLHYGFDPKWNYLEKAKKLFSFNLIPIDMNRYKDFQGEMKSIEFIKRIRYRVITSIGMEYDVVCLLDSDMFFVSDEFVSFFEMVNGTRYLIGCNEKFKWEVGPNNYFEGNGKQLFDKPDKLHAMICNVPSVFDMKKWIDVFNYYNDIAFTGYQIKGNIRVGIGDIFAHNISIQNMNRCADVIMFPMETMTQVHHTWINPNTYVIRDGDRWRSAAGDKMYMIHDTKRICRKTFVSDNMNKFRKDNAGCSMAMKFEGKIKNGLEAVQNEWHELTFESYLDVSDLITENNIIYRKR